MIISIDPGVSVGILVYDEGSLEFLVLKTVDTQEAFEIVRKYLSRASLIVMEEFPIENSLPFPVSHFYTAIISNSQCKVKLIKPGLWKPVAEKLNWKAEIARSDHERDAVNLLQYHFWTEAEKP
jgi:hypothetical protein